MLVKFVLNLFGLHVSHREIGYTNFNQTRSLLLLAFSQFRSSYTPREQTNTISVRDLALLIFITLKITKSKAPKLKVVRLREFFKLFQNLHTFQSRQLATVRFFDRSPISKSIIAYKKQPALYLP